jgi:hypothetical protein
MTNIFVVAAVISITFLITKFIEMRFIEKESKPLKLLIRDTLLVYFSVIIANFVMDQINSVIKEGPSTKVTPVFTDNPGF